MYRKERIDDIRSQLNGKTKPGFALFYGLTYKDQYSQIAGGFNRRGFVWNKETLCVLVIHPAWRYADSNVLSWDRSRHAASDFCGRSVIS